MNHCMLQKCSEVHSIQLFFCTKPITPSIALYHGHFASKVSGLFLKTHLHLMAEFYVDISFKSHIILLLIWEKNFPFEGHLFTISFQKRNIEKIVLMSRRPLRLLAFSSEILQNISLLGAFTPSKMELGLFFHILHLFLSSWF